MTWFLGLFLVLALILPARADERACEDRLRELGVYADAVARARTRTELEASRTIAELLKQRDALRSEVESLKAQKGQ